MESAKQKGLVLLNGNEKHIKSVMNSLKGDVLKEFEKICPSDMSFHRMKKDMHDAFEKAERELLDK